MNSSPTVQHRKHCTALLLPALLSLSLGACTTKQTRTEQPVSTRHTDTNHSPPLPTIFNSSDTESQITFFASQMFADESTAPARLIGRTRQTRDTDLTLDALETIILSPANGLTEPLSASVEIFGFEGKFSPCKTPNGDPPISRYQAIVQSGGPGTTGVGSANERTFEVDIFGTVESRDDNVTIMGVGNNPRSRTKRTNTNTQGTTTSVWTNNIVPGTTIPDLPTGATDVRIDAAILIAGFNELDANNTKTLCIEFIDDNGDPMSRTNEILGNPATTRELTVNSELGYIILVTYNTSAGARYLQWSGNIELNALGEPAAGAISGFSSTNPLRDDGKELAYDMQRRATMMLIRYADKIETE